MYDITSSCADDFINHEEILDTLAYADQNKENSTLIDSIIQKAKKDKKWIKGLTTFDRHDKIIKSLKQVAKKFFEN